MICIVERHRLFPSIGLQRVALPTSPLALTTPQLGHLPIVAHSNIAMFSPSLSSGPSKGATTNSAPMTTRSRRRQRPLSSDNSLPQPKAKRQRRPLTEQTFADPQPTRAASAAAAPNSYNQNATRQSRPEQRQERAVSQSNRELSVRPKKSKYADRAARGDGTSLLVSDSRALPQIAFTLISLSTLQTTNAAYDVRKLPALPDRLKSDVTST